MKDQTKVIAALLIGAAAGAALGLLLAPEKGETVRDGIADYINDLIESAKSKAQSTTDDLKQFGNGAFARAKSKFGNAANNGSESANHAADTVKTEASHVKDEPKHHYNGIKNKAKSTANDWNNTIHNS